VAVFKSHVLALRALGNGIGGDPPFDILPQLGGDALLRGYYQGRFRDRDLLAFQAEYRAPVWWKLGAVAFASAGQVAPDLGGLRVDAFHPAAGFGFRFLIQEAEGVRIRADFAWGFDVESSGFYINIGEAF
jgi:outer membrane translocation and assembly module TamA